MFQIGNPFKSSTNAPNRWFGWPGARAFVIGFTLSLLLRPLRPILRRDRRVQAVEQGATIRSGARWRGVAGVAEERFRVDQHCAALHAGMGYVLGAPAGSPCRHYMPAGGGNAGYPLCVGSAGASVDRPSNGVSIF
jgi:hypothetical protein